MNEIFASKTLTTSNGLWFRCVSKLNVEMVAHVLHTRYTLLITRYIHLLFIFYIGICNVFVYCKIFITKYWMFWCMLPTTLVTGNWYARHPYIYIYWCQYKITIDWNVDCGLYDANWTFNTEHGTLNTEHTAWLDAFLFVSLYKRR